MSKRIIFLILTLCAGLFAADWQEFMVKNAVPPFAPEKLDAETSTSTVVGAKNPKLAFAMSAIVPGSGQVYAKSYIKAAVFAGIEVTAWALYAKYSKNGNQIEDEFHTYANTHWSEEEYWKWIAQQARASGVNLQYDPNNLEPLREWEGRNFSHGLHREKDQQYYEMIGKYHQFSYGWDDFRENNDISVTHQEITQRYNETGTINANRFFYESRRDASNNAFKKATSATTVAILNHLLSAVDAAWTSTRYNRRITVGLRLEPIYYSYEPQTALTLRVMW